MVRWEYKVSYGETESYLNLMGQQGWELVAVTGTGPFTFYWKRPLP